jgi:hypothetical protein
MAMASVAKEFRVPLGLGARHIAAAGISQDTDAIAIVVSETLGEVRVFQKGRCVMQLNPKSRHPRPIVEFEAITPVKGTILIKSTAEAVHAAEVAKELAAENKEAKEAKEATKESKDFRGEKEAVKIKDGKDKPKSVI